MHSFINSCICSSHIIHTCVAFFYCVLFHLHYIQEFFPLRLTKSVDHSFCFKWQVPSVNHFTKFFFSISTLSFQTLSCMPFVKLLYFCLYPFKSNKHVPPCIFIFCIFVGYYFKSNRQDFTFKYIHQLLFQK